MCTKILNLHSNLREYYYAKLNYLSMTAKFTTHFI